MLNIAIVDDKKQELKRINDYTISILKTINIDYHVDCYDCTNIKSHYDILFLDIDMPNEDGIHFAKRYIQDHETMIVFITNRDDLVYQVFSVRPYAFIQKKYIERDLPSTIHYLIKEYYRNHQTLTIQNKNEVIHLNLKDILFIESLAHYVYIYTNNQIYKYRNKLDDMMKMIHSDSFCRVHQSYCINFYHITKINNQDIVIQEQIIPLSRKYKDEVLKKYRQFIARRI